MLYKATKEWIRELNRKSYAGYADWRLPTLEESASLLESSTSSNGLYIDPVFSSRQRRIWTCDQHSASRAMWYVYFFDGRVYWSLFPVSSYVRPVRPRK